MPGLLLCPAKSTVSNLICARGGQQADRTADYRLYSKSRVDESVLFGRVRDTLIENLAPGEPLVVAVDDTINRKTGRKIHGSGWKRDPLGPAFLTNLIHAQRFLQFSAAWPLGNGEASMVPIDFLHAPTPDQLLISWVCVVERPATSTWTILMDLRPTSGRLIPPKVKIQVSMPVRPEGPRVILA